MVRGEDTRAEERAHHDRGEQPVGQADERRERVGVVGNFLSRLHYDLVGSLSLVNIESAKDSRLALKRK